MPSDTRPVETHVLYVGGASEVYCADFQDYPEVTAGATLSSPAVTITNPAGATHVSVGSPTVLVTNFTQLDRSGNVLASVPSGKGVKFTATAVAKGQQVTATVTALCSSGETIAKQVYFKVQ